MRKYSWSPQKKKLVTARMKVSKGELDKIYTPISTKSESVAEDLSRWQRMPKVKGHKLYQRVQKAWKTQSCVEPIIITGSGLY